MKLALGISIIVIAIIWAVIILVISNVLSGVPQLRQVLLFIGGGVAVTIIILGGISIGKKSIK